MSHRGSVISPHWGRYASIAPELHNEITLRAVEMVREYEPGIYIPASAPITLISRRAVAFFGDYGVPTVFHFHYIKIAIVNGRRAFTSEV
jgi:hypothetical protein